jgi:hypothetical protein
MEIFRSRVWFNAETSTHRERGYRRRSPLVRKWLRKYGINASDVMKQETPAASRSRMLRRTWLS